MVAKEEVDYFFKILIVGDSGCGKTSILFKFTDGSFQENHILTIGVEGKTKFLIVQDKKVKLQIMDTAGQERFRSITKNYYKSANGIFFVYDITSKNTFKSLKDWINQAEFYAKKINFRKIIIGNKVDLNDEREVSLEEASAFANKVNCNILETSAKTDVNITESFSMLVKELIEERMEQEKGGNVERERRERLEEKNDEENRKDNCAC